MKHKRLFALALVLCMALPLAACNLKLKPAATWEGLRTSLDGLQFGGGEAVQGSGNVVDAETLLPADLDGVALRVEGFSIRGKGSPELALVIDESLDRKIVLSADDNIVKRISVRYDAAAGKIYVGPEDHREVFSPTKIRVTVGAPVRELVADGLWKISYDCPSVKNFSVTVDGTVNGDFTFGALDRLDMLFGGLSTIDMKCQSVKDCILGVDGTLNGKFDFGAMDRMDVNACGLSTIDMTCQSVKDCKLYVDGSLNGKCDFGEMDSIDATISGLGTLRLAGTARRAALRIEGGGSISAYDLTAQDAVVSIEGLGHCEITAERSLDASIDGAGSILHDGDAKVTKRNDGLGSIRHR